MNRLHLGLIFSKSYEYWESYNQLFYISSGYLKLTTRK